MSYNIYQDDELIGTTEEKTYKVTGLEPNKDYNFSVTRVKNGNESERASITVKTKPVEVESVTVAPKTNNLEIGATRQINVTIEPSNATNQDVTYSSDNEDVATISATGLVTAVAEGTATITATVDGKSDTSTVNVTEPEPEEGG